MAHEITLNINGTTEAVFGFGEVPWWNSNQYPALVMDRAVSFDEVFTIAFPWVAIQEQLQYPDGGLSSRYGIRRSDTMAELGIHSENYGNIQPRDLFNFCAAFFEEGNVPIASAISMRGGKVLNISAKVGEIDVLGSGDIHKTYLCFVNSFDGSMKAEVYKSYVQPVCMNTTRYGLNVADFRMVYKHTKNVQRRIHQDIHQARLLLDASAVTDEKVKEVLETLAKRRIDKATYESILNELFGEGDSTRLSNTKAAFTDVVAYGKNAVAFPDFKGTAYGVYTAFTDWLDHQRPVRVTAGRGDQSDTQIRAEASLIGPVAQQKEELLERLVELTDGCIEIEKVYSIPAPSTSNSQPSTSSILEGILASMDSTVDVTSSASFE